MRGSLLQYDSENSIIDYIAVVLEYREGFHIKKTWSADWYLVIQPLCKIYWFSEPVQKPVSARHEIAKEWRGDVQLSFGFGHPGTFSEEQHSVIEEWDMLSEEEEWYFMKNFKIIERIQDD
jgi:hypothetical protein